jgi:hypothetical protein
VSPILFPQDVRQIILQQNFIGWRQLFNGRFAIEWARVQDDYYHNKVGPTNARQNRSTRQQTGVQRQQKLIQEIWKQWKKVWKSRNELVHGQNAKAQSEANRVNANMALHRIYDQRGQNEPQDQQLLFAELNEPLQRRQLKYAIGNTSPHQFLRLASGELDAITGVRSVRSYFAPVR